MKGSDAGASASLTAFSAFMKTARAFKRIAAWVAAREHYSRVEKELPFILSLALVSLSSGASIDNFFASAWGRCEIRSFSQESEKYFSLRLAGIPWDTCLEALESNSKSPRYKTFLRGLKDVASTSLRLPEYVSEFFETHLSLIENQWRDYWTKAAAVLESAFLLALSFVVACFSSALLEAQLFEKLVPAFIVLQAFVSAVGVLLLRSIRPGAVVSVNTKKGRALLVFPWTAFAALQLAPLTLEAKLVLSSTALFIGGILAELKRIEAFKSERETLEAFRTFAELARSGYSSQSALRESGVLKLAHERRDLEAYVHSLIKFVASSIDRFGEIKSDFANILQTYLTRLVEIRDSNRLSMFSLAAIGTLFPALIYVLSSKALLALQLSKMTIESFSAFFFATALAAGIAVSEAVDGAFLFSLKPGMSCLLISLAIMLF